MKSSNNVVTAKKAPVMKDDNFVNLELASKAMINFKTLITSGKNATILNDIANQFVNKKENANFKALQKDGVLKELQSKMLQCQTLPNARKITQNDNYFDYAKFVKQILSKKVELNENQKGQVKTIVATAQVLRNGILSKYAHGEASWADVQAKYNISTAPVELPTGENTAESLAEAQAEIQPESQAVNMEDFKNLVWAMDNSELAIALDLIKAKMAESVEAQTELEKVA